MNPQSILEQFLGPDAAARAGGAVQSAKGSLANSGLAGVAGGVAALRALGALAYRAYQNWQSGQAAPQAAPAQQTVAPEAPPAGSKFLPQTAPARDGQPFELALVLAMIATANADGHIDAEEQRLIFDRVGELPLDAEDKGFVFDALGRPPSLQDIASLAEGPEQAAELYLVSRLAIDPDHPMERAYLEALASRLALPGELVAHLESQAAAATA